MFEAVQKIGTVISTAILGIISSFFGVQNLEMTLPQPSPTVAPESMFETSSLPTAKPLVRPTIKPTASPTTKAAEPTFSWKNVNEGGTYTVAQTLPVELEVGGIDVRKVEFTVGSDFQVCTVESKPYTCTLKLTNFFYGITGKQSFPIQAKIYPTNGDIIYKNIVIYVSP